MSPLSRRGALQTLIAAGAVAALPAPADAREKRWAELLPSLQWAHPNGMKTGLAAKAAGMDPDDIILIMLKGPGDTTKDHRPTLIFQTSAGCRSFGPRGEES